MAEVVGKSTLKSSLPLIEADGVEVHFPVASGWPRRRTGFIRAVDGVSLAVPRGETLGLVGESGSGKSTLGRALLMLRRPTKGRVVFDGKDLTAVPRGQIRTLRRRFQLVFQNPYSSLNPRMQVGQILLEPMLAHGIASGREGRARVSDLLQMVGLPAGAASRHPLEFSGGQRQRIGIARALALNPDFVVLDEPISALDVSVQGQILNLLLRLRDELGLTYLFISHNLGVVRHLSHRVAVMYLGRVVEMGPVLSVYASPGHPYTRALFSAIPIPDPGRERHRSHVILHGDIPSPAAPPPGCRFHTRCWLYEKLGRPSICREQDPPLADLHRGHAAACHFLKESVKSRVGDDQMVPASSRAPDA